METITIAIIGEERVGKTNIASRIIDNKFEYSYRSTYGAELYQKNMVLKNFSEEFKISIWDSSGQPLFKSLIRTFYKEASIVLVVFNMTDRKTYEESINFWIKSAKEICVNNPLICLVANYCELDEAYAVSINELKQFGDENYVQIYMVSAKNNIGIQEMLEDIITKYADSRCYYAY